MLQSAVQELFSLSHCVLVADGRLCNRVQIKSKLFSIKYGVDFPEALSGLLYDMFDVHLIEVGSEILRPYPHELLAYVRTVNHLLECADQSITLWLLESHHITCIHLFQELLCNVVSEAAHEIQESFLYETGLWKQSQVEPIVIVKSGVRLQIDGELRLNLRIKHALDRVLQPCTSRVYVLRIDLLTHQGTSTHYR